MAKRFKGIAATPIRGKAPGFATVLFGTQDSNGLFIQETGRSDTIKSFRSIELLPSTPVVYLAQNRTREVRRKALYGFLSLKKDVLTGTKKELIGALREQIPSLEEYPFVRHQVAKFVGDPQAIADAQLAVASLLKRDSMPSNINFPDGLPALGAIPRLTLKTTAFRLMEVPSHFSFDLASDDRTELERIELSTRPSYPAIAVSGSAGHFFQSLRRPTPYPTLFSEGRESGLYAALTREGAIMEISSYRFRQNTALGLPSETSRHWIFRVELEGTYYDLTAYEPLAEAEALRRDFAPFQKLGRALRSLGGDGILYPSRVSQNGTNVYVFSADSLVRADLDGTVELSASGGLLRSVIT